mmetsp:Transcript_18380/g.29911  ORF Transcript_18380/g.29911 Transcript_18380/m.29911 type:complete len:90 (+) Transcript_18380:135-404(+)
MRDSIMTGVQSLVRTVPQGTTVLDTIQPVTGNADKGIDAQRDPQSKIHARLACQVPTAPNFVSHALRVLTPGKKELFAKRVQQATTLMV